MRFAVQYALCLWCLAAILPVYSADKQVNSEKDALAIAQSFTQQNGWTFPGIPYPVADKDDHNYPLWRVGACTKESDQMHVVSVWIDRASGQVTSGINSLLGIPPPPEQPQISLQQAEAIARKVVTIAGVSLDAFKLQASNPKPGKISYWSLTFWRMYGQYRFYHDAISFMIGASDGVVSTFSISNRSPLPTSTTVTVKQTDAEATAKQYLTAHQIAVDRIALEGLFIVQPNGSFEHWDERVPYTSSRLAWVIRYYKLNGGGHSSEAWVDAETGDVIGGWKAY